MFDYNAYFEAISIGEAVTYLDAHENARIIAGGTDVLIKLRERKDFVGCDLVGIRRIPVLSAIKVDADGTVTIGACASFTEIEGNAIVRQYLPVLAQAAAVVGGPQIRNMGTIGGNIANGATSADTAGPLFAYNAVLVIQNGEGTREIPIAEFYKGPGKVALNQGDILTAIQIKKQDYDGFIGRYIKFSSRKAMDIGTLCCSALVKPNGDRIGALRVAFGVAGPVPLRAAEAEAFAIGKPLTPETFAQIGEKCLESTRARDSWRASKRFREQLIKVLPGKALTAALAQTGREGV